MCIPNLALLSALPTCETRPTHKLRAACAGRSARLHPRWTRRERFSAGAVAKCTAVVTFPSYVCLSTNHHFLRPLLKLFSPLALGGVPPIRLHPMANPPKQQSPTQRPTPGSSLRREGDKQQRRVWIPPLTNAHYARRAIQEVRCSGGPLPSADTYPWSSFFKAGSIN